MFSPIVVLPHKRDLGRLGVDQLCEHRLHLQETGFPEIFTAFAGTFRQEFDIPLHSTNGMIAERMLCRGIEVCLV